MWKEKAEENGLRGCALSHCTGPDSLDLSVHQCVSICGIEGAVLVRKLSTALAQF